MKFSQDEKNCTHKVQIEHTDPIIYTHIFVDG